jgi:hypothetical protein
MVKEYMPNGKLEYISKITPQNKATGRNFSNGKRFNNKTRPTMTRLNFRRAKEKLPKKVIWKITKIKNNI